VVEVGDDITGCVNDESVVMINHQSTADVPVLMSLVSHANKGTLAHHVDYVMDVMFRFFPFGWVGLMHGDFFIRQVLELQLHIIEFPTGSKNSMDGSNDVIVVLEYSVVVSFGRFLATSHRLRLCEYRATLLMLGITVC